MDSYQEDNEPSGSIKTREHSDEPIYYKLLKKDSDQWS
jgi:hypothetical protein